MKKAKQYTIHMVGHGHIDPTWLWRWTEGYEEVRATFRSALDRMRETPEFKFTSTSACFYLWMRMSEPELFEQIQERVKEGRWELAGGFWIEPDCNIPCGESFVRHGLYAQRFFQKEFGMRARVGFNPDSFGHAGTLPQILKKLGIDYYVYMRPSPVFEMDYPEGTTFWWEAADGSKVLACNLPEDYVADTNVLERVARLPQHPHLNPGQTQILGFYGVGNHGGGPTKQAIAEIQAAQQDTDLPNVQFATLQEYFEAFEKEAKRIPVVKKELQHHARGCYSTHAHLKRLHRQVEHALMTAERFAAAAWLLDAQPYPHDQFEKAWIDLLYNQFHDILAGTSIASSYEDTRDQLGAARHRADVIINQAIQAIARDIDTTAAGNTIVVVNPLPWPVDQPVLASPIIERKLHKPIHLVDEEEQYVPSQAVQGERVGGSRYAFTAKVPAMGYRVYHARSGVHPKKPLRDLKAGADFLENEWWRLEFDKSRGCLTRLFDKTRHSEILNKGNFLSCLLDNSDTWSHEVREYRVEEGRFGQAELELAENGEVLAKVRVRSRFGASTAIQEVTLYRDLDLIDLQLDVNWQEQYRALKLGFDTKILHGAATYDAPYGCQERDTSGQEEPGQQWFDLTGTVDGLPYGLAILNDGTYGYDVRDGVMRITILRSPAYAHHDPARYESGAGYALMDQGWHRVRFRLLPHAGTWRDTRVVKSAWELNAAVVSHVESAHPGKRPALATLLGTEAENVLLSVVKQSEDGEELVVRGYETCGRPAETTLHIPYFGQAFRLEFQPHEIKTLRISPENWELREVNLLEE